LDAELDGWRHNDVRFFAHRVDVLERQLRRRTWTLGSALAFSLVLVAAVTTLSLLPLLPDLKLQLTAGSIEFAGKPTPFSNLIAPEPASQQPTELQRLTAPEL
jgi:hypothetical protein